LNTLGVWQKKEDQTTTANPVIIRCLHLSHLLYGISWKVDFLCVFKETVSACIYSEV